MKALSRLMQLTAMTILLIVGFNNAPVLAQNANANAQPRTSAQLEQLVAPIALYPDALLSQVLMASTYPLEVVAAARWSKENPGMTGDALQNALAAQSWDPSVKSLTAVPQTLQMMNDKLDWTQQLGDAFLAQQSEVLDAVQRLRARADANGYLKSTPEQKVTSTPRQPATSGQGQAAPSQAAPGQAASSSVPANVYAIEPVNPDQYYVPVYDPGVVYGDWPYPDYEPFYWYPPGYALGPAYGYGALALTGAALWGAVDWARNRVQVNPLRYNNFNRTNIGNSNWAHNPAHRGSVPYRDRSVAQRFGNQGAGAARESFRGKADAGRQQLSKGNAGAKGTAKSNAGKAGGKQASKGKQGGSKQAARNKQGGSKQTARNKQGGSKQTARNKQGGSSKQAARNRQGGSKQAARSKQGGSRQAASRSGRSSGPSRSAAPRQAARGPTTSGQGFRSAGARAGGGRSFGGGGRGGGGRGGGGRRSDIRLKHDIALLGRLENGLGFYRFIYNGGATAFVGVMAQDVKEIMPTAVIRGADGYYRVLYDKLGLKFQTYDHWIANGARMPRLDSPASRKNEM